ncbi:hypothetical protein ACTWPT_58580 [Nonomuraea sp. 3N208]
MTSSKPFGHCGEVFGVDVVATAVEIALSITPKS